MATGHTSAITIVGYCLRKPGLILGYVLHVHVEWGVTPAQAKISKSASRKPWKGIEAQLPCCVYILSSYGVDSVLPTTSNMMHEALRPVPCRHHGIPRFASRHHVPHRCCDCWPIARWQPVNIRPLKIQKLPTEQTALWITQNPLRAT